MLNIVSPFFFALYRSKGIKTWASSRRLIIKTTSLGVVHRLKDIRWRGKRGRIKYYKKVNNIKSMRHRVEIESDIFVNLSIKTLVWFNENTNYYYQIFFSDNPFHK